MEGEPRLPPIRSRRSDTSFGTASRQFVRALHSNNFLIVSGPSDQPLDAHPILLTGLDEEVRKSKRGSVER